MDSKTLKEKIFAYSFVQAEDKQCIDRLFKDVRVNESSLRQKLVQIVKNSKSPQNAIDLIVELLVACELLELSETESITFAENPDLYLELSQQRFAIEVKNFRYREKDNKDGLSFEQAGQVGRLTEYGDSENVQTQMENVLTKKANNCSVENPLILFLQSRSPHNVEAIEAKCAARTVFYNGNHSNLLGIMFRMNNSHPLLFHRADNESEQKIVESFRQRFYRISV